MGERTDAKRRSSLALLGKVEGAEKLLLSGRRRCEHDLESAVTFFLEFLVEQGTIDESDLALAPPARTPEEAVRIVREGHRGDAGVG